MSRSIVRSSFVKSFVVAAIASFGAVSSAAAASWDAFTIRGTPIVTDTAPSYEFKIISGGDKAALGTSDVDGVTLDQLGSLSINRTDDYTRFSINSGPYVAPYLNIWITDGTNYAVIANEPSNPEWTSNPGSMWNMTWDDLKTKTVKVYENSDKSWLPNNGVGLTFNDLGNFTILAPTVSQLTTGWAGLSTGAPRELGTNIAYGINWVFGDTLTNYVSGDPGYQVNTPSVTAAVPTPAAALAGIPLLSLLALKRRRA